MLSKLQSDVLYGIILGILAIIVVFLLHRRNKESFQCKDKKIRDECVREFKESSCPNSKTMDKCIARYDICGTIPADCTKKFSVGNAQDPKLAEQQGIAHKNLCEPMCRNINDCCFLKTSRSTMAFSS